MQRKAAAFALETEAGAWWDYWHYHADWPGWGNRRWRYRLEHLRALCRVFRTIADARDRFATPFQTWIVLDGTDAGQDATFLHTPNGNGTPFPFRPEGVTWGESPLREVMPSLLPGLTLELGVARGVDDDDEPPTHWTKHWIWAREIGEPLAR